MDGYNKSKNNNLNFQKVENKLKLYDTTFHTVGI